MALVSFAEMQDVIASAFINAGMIEQEAQQCARIHTESTLDGVNSHGVNRVAQTKTVTYSYTCKKDRSSSSDPMKSAAECLAKHWKSNLQK